MRDAEQLTSRVTITGQTLPPDAARDCSGLAGRPSRSAALEGDPDIRARSPGGYAGRHRRIALSVSWPSSRAKLRPDQLEKVANRCAVLINPDGKFSDVDRARQRGFTWSTQRSDGMSVGKLVASPELRANLDAWLARFAAPGMCDPDDESPCVAGEPDDLARTRYAQSCSATARRAQRAGARSIGRSKTRSTQRTTGDGRRVDHAAGTQLRDWAGGDGRRNATAHARPHPDG